MVIFIVIYNKLTSFEYAPKIIRGDFYCNVIILKHLNISLVMLKDIFVVIIIQYMKYGDYLMILVKLNY